MSVYRSFAVIVLLVLLVVASVYLSARRGTEMGEPKSPEDYAKEQGYFISTESETRERASRVLPHEASEDVARLLRPPDLPQPAHKQDHEERDSLPNPLVEWIVHVDFEADPIFDRSKLLTVLSPDWAQQCGSPQLFGFSPEDGHWTYLRAGGVPETYTQLKFSWDFYKTYTDPPVVMTADKLSEFVESIRAACNELGNASIRLETSPAEGEKRAEFLRELVESSDREVVVVLQAPPAKTFDGRDIWDVMLCLGLPWGDMDIFHWRNESGVGDDTFFSVWTSTNPGYFFPENIAAGEVHTEDLVFGFLLPRSAAPVQVFREMVKAAKYAQQRLGGVLLNASGQELDEAETIAAINAISEHLTEAGFAPGSDASLRLF